MMDTAGVRQVAYEYAAFGDAIETTGAADNLRGFGAHWRDDESHLVYMGARYQDPVLGRFTQPDPVIPEPGDPQSWNRYSYVRNNPVNRIDPTGSIDTAADIADRWKRNADQSSEILSESVLDNGGAGRAALAATAQTAIDIGAGAVDMLRFGEGSAQGGWGYAQDALRAIGIAAGMGQALGAAARGVQALGAVKAASGTARSGAGSVDDLLKGATRGKTGKSLQFTRPGDAADANQAFDRLARGNKVMDQGGGVRSTTLSDGGTASVRPSSTGGHEKNLEQIRRFASELVQHVTAIRMSLADDLGWSIVPIESGAHFDDDDAERLAAAIRASGNDAVVAIATESLVAEPAGYRVPATGHGLREFSQRCGHFNYLLVPEDEGFAILCTVDDYYLVAGPENFVRCAVGGDIERARREFQDFAGDPVWPDDTRKNLLSIAAQYQTT